MLIEYNLLKGELSSLEFETKENIQSLLEILKEGFLKENIIQLPQFLIAHIAAYLGLFSVISMRENILPLEERMFHILKEHAHFSREKFNKYLP